MAAPESGLLFVCHSSRDAELANTVVAGLEARGHACWIAPRDIRTGAHYGMAILDGIERACAVLVLLTRDSAASQHCALEVERSVTYKRGIIVVCVDGQEPSRELELFLCLSQWVQGSRMDPSAIVDAVSEAIPGVAKPAYTQAKSTEVSAAYRSAAEKLEAAHKGQAPAPSEPPDGDLPGSASDEQADAGTASTRSARVWQRPRALVALAAILVAVFVYGFVGNGKIDTDSVQARDRVERAVLRELQTSLKWCGDCLGRFQGWPSHDCDLSDILEAPSEFPFAQTAGEPELIRRITRLMKDTDCSKLAALSTVSVDARSAGLSSVADDLGAFGGRLQALCSFVTQELARFDESSMPAPSESARLYRHAAVVALAGTFWQLQELTLQGTLLARELPSLLPADVEAALTQTGACDLRAVRDAASAKRYLQAVERQIALIESERRDVIDGIPSHLPATQQRTIRSLLGETR